MSEEKKQIRVRFAPSPTGYLHIGSARTALFNWLYARANNGTFILRIEDTDLERSDTKYMDEILASLKWLGLNWDEELYFQSKRFAIYKERAEQLVKEEKAYYEDTEKGKAIRLHMLKDRAVVFYDAIRDKIEMNTSTFGGDLVLMKSDGSPTYNFACVVDDIDMAMTHIIRGDDHIANTPKQVLIYEAFGIKPPKFVHIPLILSEDKSRMSKRFGATSIGEYRQMGYLPEALVNFLALMGWSPKDNREKLSVKQIVSLFTLKSLNKTGAVFNIQKLNWLNAEYIKEKPVKELCDFVAGHLMERGVLDPEYDRQKLESIVKLFQTRFSTIDEFIEKTVYFFKDEIEYEADAVTQHLKKDNAAGNLLKLKDKLSALGLFDIKTLEDAMRSLAQELGVEAAELIHPARVALTGKASAPGIFEVMHILGKERVIERLDKIPRVIASS